MAVNREALAAALAYWERPENAHLLTYGNQQPILTVARERLAQLPDEQGVYPAALVEQIADVLHNEEVQRPESVRIHYRRRAVAVLDALNGETPTCPGGELLTDLVEITVDSVHPNALECSDLPWPPEDHIKEAWRYALLPLGPASEGEE